MKTLLALLTATIGLTCAQLSTAATDTAAAEGAETATVIVYRNDDSVRSRGIKFDVRAEQRNQGRIAAGEAIVIKREAGTFVLSSSLQGSPSLELNLKPGQVHYVEYDLTVRNNRTDLELNEVGEQVAKVRNNEIAELTI
ncbi:hypothetical protein EY643_12985 [Halioglobus maricola]|uniref:DUF2846 domain-containing protein n=1 Tax=Halioglobus maricola TaxID=2601894 RepID=A0A5P9NLJ9_9GAMM|nr:hypothetical protein [Halioglobus maricola]QFU76499.1 hypothetical protein EY643_12985 [Halioglobus maricola]